MIRRVKPSEAAQVFDLLRKVYATHSFLEQGVDAYRDLLQSGRYVSLGDFEGGTLRVHAGYGVHPDFALISLLVVDPAIRGGGLGRAIFEARLADIESSQTVPFVVGYSMMQHLWSQRLYSDEFKPIGLDIGYPDIYHQADSVFNRGDASNAELVLCWRISGRKSIISLNVPLADWRFARQILASLNVTCHFDESQLSSPASSGTFLGFHPDPARGLFLPAYLTSEVDFGPLLTSNQEREAFIQAIKERHESASR